MPIAKKQLLPKHFGTRSSHRLAHTLVAIGSLDPAPFKDVAAAIGGDAYTIYLDVMGLEDEERYGTPERKMVRELGHGTGLFTLTSKGAAVLASLAAIIEPNTDRHTPTCQT